MAERASFSEARQAPAVSLLRRFAGDQGGATAIEYALMATGIAVAIASFVFGLGETVLTNQFENIANATSGT